MILAQQVAVPALDPIGLPAEPQWLVFLMLLTLLLHVLFMNFVLGGSILALGLNVAALLGRSQANTWATVVYQMMPPMLSMAVTMGVAPLLFVQVLYGPFFYSANVLLGFAWLVFFIVVLVGFYLSYWLTFRGSSVLQGRIGTWDDKPGRRLVIGAMATACFLWVAWTLTNNHELSLRPELWASQGQWKSPRWYVPAPTTIVRYLHDVVGATAIAGLWMAGIGWWRLKRITDRREVHEGMIRFGLIAAAAASIVQIGLGLVFLFMLESPMRSSLMGFNSVFGGIWTVLLLAAVGLPFLLAYAALHADSFRWLAFSAALAVVVLISMLLGHTQVRFSALNQPAAGAFSLDQWTAYPQRAPLILMLILLVVALGVVGLMLWWMTDRRGSATGEPPAPTT